MSHTSIREAEPALRAIVETILPTFPALPESARRGVAGDVAAYVACQIDAMPSFLRLPYRLALLAFTWLPALRFGGPFATLPAPARSSLLALWTDAPVAPMRDFVKLIRSTALLVYFDHPAVVAQLKANRPSTSLQTVGKRKNALRRAQGERKKADRDETSTVRAEPVEAPIGRKSTVPPEGADE